MVLAKFLVFLDVDLLKELLQTQIATTLPQVLPLFLLCLVMSEESYYLEMRYRNFDMLILSHFMPNQYPFSPLFWDMNNRIQPGGCIRDCYL